MNTGEHTQTSKCLRCGRTLRSAVSIRRGYGAWCRAKIRAAIIAEIVKDFTEAQVEAARELIADGALVPAGHRNIFRVVSTDGERSYLTHPQGCNCPFGLRRKLAKACKHMLGARIMVASVAR
jgi:hypothetical protein